MGMMMSALLLLLAFLGAVLVKTAADEFKAWAPWIVTRIISIAVQTLPAMLRERYEEEWTSYVNETPGDIGKIIAAIGLLTAAYNIANGRFALVKRVADIVLVSVLIFGFVPLLLIAAIFIKLNSPGPVFVRRPKINRKGNLVQVISFRTTPIDNAEVGGSAERVGTANWVSKLGWADLPGLFNALRGDISLIDREAPHSNEYFVLLSIFAGVAIAILLLKVAGVSL